MDGYARTPLMTKKEQNKDRELLFTVQFMNKKILIEALDWTETRYREIFALSHITNKISLLENFKN